MTERRVKDAATLSFNLQFGPQLVSGATSGATRQISMNGLLRMLEERIDDRAVSATEGNGSGQSTGRMAIFATRGRNTAGGNGLGNTGQCHLHYVLDLCLKGGHADCKGRAFHCGTRTTAIAFEPPETEGLRDARERLQKFDWNCQRRRLG